MRAALLSLSVLCWLLIACSGQPAPKREWTPADHGQPAEVDDSQQAPQAASDEDTEDPQLRAARALWTVKCAGCHGRDGRGLGAERPPGAQLPDFTDPRWQASQSDTALTQAITDGRGGLMPPFGKQINPQGIAALVQHIRRFAASDAPNAGATPQGDREAQQASGGTLQQP